MCHFPEKFLCYLTHLKLSLLAEKLFKENLFLEENFTAIKQLQMS